MDHIKVLEKLRCDLDQIIDNYSQSLIIATNERKQHSDIDNEYNSEIILYIQYAILIYKTSLQMIDILENQHNKL